MIEPLREGKHQGAMSTKKRGNSVRPLQPPPPPIAKSKDNMERHDITTELYREYDFGGRVYRIDNPQELQFRIGGTTHRIVDLNGVVHCVPVPGSNGCVLRWQSRKNLPAVSF